MSSRVLAGIPETHRAFLRAALPRLEADARLVGVAAGGSLLAGTMDEFSDLDLVIGVEPAAVDAVMAERHTIAAGLGHLLAAFTGEHVGEPRLLICLYAGPLLHVDLKFASLEDVAERVEDPAILWEREGRLSGALARCAARSPAPEVQWIEDRFWVWIHYAAAKIGRGELFEAQESLAFLRTRVLAPLAAHARGAHTSGVRRIEHHAPGFAARLERTVATHDARACAAALEECARLYRELRAGAAGSLVIGDEAELAAMGYLQALQRRLGAG